MRIALEPGTAVQMVRVQSVVSAGEGTLLYAGSDPDHGPVVLKEYFPMALARRSSDGCSVVCERKEDEHAFDRGLEAYGRLYDVLGGLTHPSLPRVRRLLSAHDTLYAVMSRVDGESLEAHALKVPGMYESRIRAIFSPLLDALALIHEAGLAHLGIYPGNIWLPSAGVARWTGLRTRPDDEPISPEMLGYAPSEQTGQPEGTSTGVGPWTDFHALGMCMLHCVSGRPPETPEGREAERRNAGSDPINRLLVQEWRRFSADFLDVLTWMTQPEPRSRPSGADLIRHVLDPHQPTWVPEGLGFEHAPSAPVLDRPDRVHEALSAGPAARFELDPSARASLEGLMREHVGALAPAVLRRSLIGAGGAHDVLEFLLENVPAARREEAALELAHLLDGADRAPDVPVRAGEGGLGSAWQAPHPFEADPFAPQGAASVALDTARIDFDPGDFDVVHPAPARAPHHWDLEAPEHEIDPDWEDVFEVEPAQASEAVWGEPDVLSPPSMDEPTPGEPRVEVKPGPLEAVELALVEVVGPIAKVMIRRARAAGDRDALIEHLIEQLDEPALEDAFLNALAERS